MTQTERTNLEKYLDEQWSAINKKSRTESENDRYYYMGLTQALRMTGYYVERRVDGVHFISSTSSKDKELKFAECEYPVNLVSDILNEKQDIKPTKLAIDKLTEALNHLHPRKKNLILMYYKERMPFVRISEVRDLPVSHVKDLIIDGIRELRKDKILCKALRGEMIGGALPDITDKHYITESKLNQRVKNCLRRAGIETFEDLNGRSWKQLLRIRGFGALCQNELIPYVKEYNIYLKDGRNTL